GSSSSRSAASSRASSTSVRSLLRLRAARRPRVHDRRATSGRLALLSEARTSSARSEHPARKPSIDRPGQACGISERRLLEAVPQDREAVAGPRALGGDSRRVGTTTLEERKLLASRILFVAGVRMEAGALREEAEAFPDVADLRLVVLHVLV